MKKTLPQRLEMTGEQIYGSAWRRRLAAGLGISRGTLWAILRGSRKSGLDIDGAMLDLIDRERDAASERGVALTRLRNSLLATIKGERDAAA